MKHASLGGASARSIGLVVWLVCLAVGGAVRADGADRFALRDGESVVVVGNSFAERIARSGYLEALIHAAHPSGRITVRQAPWSGDEVGLRERELNVPDSDSYLREHKADVIIAFFGMSESFRGESGLDAFESDLRKLLAHYREGKYNGSSSPRIILVSPIAHESTGAARPTPEEIGAHNRAIGAYTERMRRVATAEGVFFIDLFGASASLVGEVPGLTTNGILPGEAGCWAFTREIGRKLGWVSDSPAASTPDLVRRFRAAAWDKHYHFQYVYRPTNTEYVWGRRAEPFGVVNFPAEQAQLRRMVDARQRALWEMEKPTPEQLFAGAPSGIPVWERVPDSSAFPEDQWTPASVAPKGTETSVGDTRILPAGEFAASFTLAEGYGVQCFASEKEFPELQNPLAMAFDDRHRLWVLCAPTYPHVLPGEQPRDRLIVLTDEDLDGRADSCTVFAEGFGIATGFAIDGDSVYLANAPDLLKLSDTDGDGRADRREVVLTGFSMPDSHHQISVFEWAPDGGFYMHEGTFGRAAVETPFGTVRARDGAVWRFEPSTGHLQVLSHCYYPNPWGHVFDDFGASILDSTSGGEHFYFSHVSTAFDYPRKPRSVDSFLTRGRPTSGNEIISSRHFPEDVQGTHLVNQCIGFHGARWDRLLVSGSGWRATPMPQELIQSTDENFRPVAVKVGPDGTLFICDWVNPLIGHMQYSVRDPRRDHEHGRIWRIRHMDRETLTPPRIHGASVGGLLDLLRLPERNSRQLARRRLQNMPTATVMPALTRWLAAVAPADPLRPRLLLEGLWIRHAHGDFDRNLMKAVLASPSADARGAALRLLRLWVMSKDITRAEALEIMRPAVRDTDMRVRLEVVVGCGFVRGAGAMALAQEAAEYEMDEPFEIVLGETLDHLAGDGGGDTAIVKRLKLRRMPLKDFLAASWDDTAALVALERSDVPVEVRRKALDAVVKDGEGRMEALVDAVHRARRPGETARALLPLMVESMAAEGPDPLAALVSHDDAGVRAVAAACRRASGAAFSTLLGEDPEAAVTGVALLEENRLSEDEAGALIKAIDAAGVDPHSAVALLVDRALPSEAAVAWLTDRLDRARSTSLEAWGIDHETGMACLRAISTHPHAEIPQSLAAARIHTDAARFESGRSIYQNDMVGCARCHGVDGRGQPGFPPLDRSPWVLGDPGRGATIVIHGLRGEITVEGRTISSEMAPLGANLSDQQIADVLTYVRQSWGNFAAPVKVDDVRAVRERRFGGNVPSTTAVLAFYPFASDGLLGALVPGGVGADARATVGKGVPTASPIILTAGAFAFVAALALLGAAVSDKHIR